MGLDELIKQLDDQFGNEYAPKQYRIIQEAIIALRELRDIRSSGITIED
jgi:hypothetical protein